MIRLSVAHTHLHPGARGTLEGEAAGACRVEFADGVETSGELTAGSQGLELSVAAHVTAAGTRIAAKRWLLEIDGTAVRVIRRLP